MINMTKQEFEERKMKDKMFSVISSFRGDEVTPITLFSGLKGSKKFILESGSKANRFGRYSFMGENSYKEIMGDTLEKIEEIKKEIKKEECVIDNKFPFKGGAVGYIGYDTAILYEKTLKSNNPDDIKAPVIRFNFYKRYICFDHFTHKVDRKSVV